MPIKPAHRHHLPRAWSWEAPMNPQHEHEHEHEHQHQDQVEQEEAEYNERERMFEKPLTPSDVGKLNRLVIPKQHAEKHFPLDRDSGDKGLLLSFDDMESGKSWRFRYSYWTSSQSYVLTKGWSRFVKEKRLDAGDVVVFERLRDGGDRLYIGCRRRGATEALPSRTMTMTMTTRPNAAVPWSPVYYYTAAASSCSHLYLSSEEQDSSVLHAGDGSVEKAAPKRLRLFGVNLECGPNWPEPQQVQPEPCLTGQSPPGAPSSQL